MAESNKLHSINTSRILRAIWLNPGVSRIKVAEMLDLDRSTVTKIMQVIFDRGLAQTDGKNTSQSGVGRRQVNLKINEDIGVVLGLEIQNSRYRAVMTTISGQVLYSFDGLQETTGENLVSLIVSLVKKAKKFAKTRGLDVLGIGIGLPGILDPYSGIIIRSNPLKIAEPFDVLEDLQRYIPEAIVMDNDANSCCWGELAFSPENRNRNFIAVLGEFRNLELADAGYHGLAIGLGLVIREKVLHGDHFTAGEFRAVTANRQTGQFTISWDELKRLPEDSAVLDRVYRELTANLGFLVNSVDFTKIVFAGDLTIHQGNLRSYMADAIEENWTYNLERSFIIEFSRYGENAVCMGAAGLFVEKLFSVPDIADRFQEVVGYDLFDRILTGRNC